MTRDDHNSPRVRKTRRTAKSWQCSKLKCGFDARFSCEVSPRYPSKNHEFQMASWLRQMSACLKSMKGWSVTNRSHQFGTCPHQWTVNPLPLIRWEVGKWCVTTRAHHFKLETSRCGVFKTLTNKNKLVMPLVYTRATLITSWCWYGFFFREPVNHGIFWRESG